MGATATRLVSMLGPVSSARPGGDWGLFEVVLLLLCGLIVADRVREYKRRNGLRNLATRRGFDYLGSSLPRSFTLSGTALDGVTSVWNVIDADCGTLTADLTVDQCGEWSIMYEPKRMSLIPRLPMAVSEIEHHLAAIDS